MDIAIWVVQVLVALGFGLAGFGKLSQPKDKLYAQGMKYVEDFSPSIIKAIGTVEVLGALGVILPMVTGILPVLTPIAAGGLVLTMLGAMLTHLRRKEYPMIGVNLILLLLALFVAYGRLVLVPVI